MDIYKDNIVRFICIYKIEYYVLKIFKISLKMKNVFKRFYRKGISMIAIFKTYFERIAML